MIAADFLRDPTGIRIGHALPNAPCECRTDRNPATEAPKPARDHEDGPPMEGLLRRCRPWASMRTIPDPTITTCLLTMAETTVCKATLFSWSGPEDFPV